MKKILSESKIIRFYLLLWGLFLTGILMILLKSGWRFVSLTGFLLSLGSFIIALKMLIAIQVEIKSRYAIAIPGEKRFLKGLFYFARGIFLIMGLFFMVILAPRKAVLAQDLVEIGGKITRIETIGEHNPSLKITLENNSNQYGINTYKLSDTQLQQIENELQPGRWVYLLIQQDDKTAVNDVYVQIYGIRTETIVYLSLDEVNQANAKNSALGRYLGMFFASAGLIYMLAGNVAGTQDQIKSQDQNLTRT